MENKITIDVLRKTSVEITKLLMLYQVEINKTFQEELTVSINMPIKIDTDSNGLAIKAGINFVKSRVKDESLLTIDPNQKQLFPENEVVL